MKVRTFILFAVLFGALFVFLIPPFQSPDESNHFLRAYQVSEGHFFPEKRDRRLGGTLPVSLSGVCDSFLYLRLNPEARLTSEAFLRFYQQPLQAGQRQFTDFANTAIYAPTAYLPQATAIALLRPMGASPLQLLYAARLANLLVWILLIGSTLHTIPFMRGALATLALFPASLVLASSAGADVFTNGLCWWLIATFLAKYPTSAGWKQYVAAGVIAMNKLITVPLALLSPLMEKKHRKCIGLLFAAGASALLWAALSQDWFIPYDNYHPAYRDTQTLNSGVHPARQLAFVLEHPVYFLQVAGKSMFEAGPSVIAHVAGKFGWEKNYIPAVFILLLWLALAAMTFSEHNPLGKRVRLGLAGIICLYVLGFALTMYALWCAVGSAQLHNWQGRYFIPVLPLALLLAGSARVASRRRLIEYAAFLVLLLGNAAMSAAIYQRYW